MKVEHQHGRPYRPHGPILGIDEEQNQAWLTLFNWRCTIAAIAMLALLWLFVAVTS